MEASNKLIVMGYRFNSEDNHINSIIAEWLRGDRSREMIVFNYNSGIKLDRIKCFQPFLEEQIVIKDCSDGNESRKKFEEEIKLIS